MADGCADKKRNTCLVRSECIRRGKECREMLDIVRVLLCMHRHVYKKIGPYVARATDRRGETRGKKQKTKKQKQKTQI